MLIIDEDDTERRYIATLLAADGFDVIQVQSVVAGLVQEMAHEPALIILAEETSPVRVHEVIALLRRLSKAPVIVVGGGGEIDELTSLDSGGDYYLSRPVRGAELTTRARQLIQRGARDIRETRLRSVCRGGGSAPGRAA